MNIPPKLFENIVFLKIFTIAKWGRTIEIVLNVPIRKINLLFTWLWEEQFYLFFWYCRRMFLAIYVNSTITIVFIWAWTRQIVLFSPGTRISFASLLGIFWNITYTLVHWPPNLKKYISVQWIYCSLFFLLYVYL